MLLTGIISTVLARYGIQIADRNSWLPKNHYHRRALDCLKADDIEGAVANNRIARDKDPDYLEAQVVQELILMWLDTRIVKAEKEIAEETKKQAEYEHALKSAERTARKTAAKHALIPAAVGALPAGAALALLQHGSPLISIPAALFLLILSESLVFYYLIRRRLFDPERSPVVRLYEESETNNRKLDISARRIRELKPQLDWYQKTREEIKQASKKYDTLLQKASKKFRSSGI